MKLVTFSSADFTHLGAVHGEQVVDLTATGAPALASMQSLLDAGDAGLAAARTALDAAAATYALSAVTLRAPLPFPRSVRDFYAFEQHVRTARANRGAEMIPDWYDIAIFYFSNHQAITGPYDPVACPKASRALDFELEVACVIGKGGRDIPIERAAEHIAGYCVMNDWSARDLQMKEMKMNLGPAKGKDFATTLGPWLVTPDELAPYLETRPTGTVYNLAMLGRIDGQECSRGNWRDIYFTFEQMIARASADVTLYPGDVLGSGTVGTGCLLELTKGQGPWLQSGSLVEMEIEALGTLANRVV